jgi:uncharacterized protein YcbK (DUF882 family)
VDASAIVTCRAFLACSGQLVASALEMSLIARALLTIVATTLAVGLAPSTAPAAGRGGATAQTHVVCRGQTLGMIARRYNVSIAAICAANDIVRNRPIFPGQKLMIPKRIRRSPKPASQQSPQLAQLKRQTNQAAMSDAERYAKQPRKTGYVTLKGRVASWQGYAVLRDGSIPARARDGFERALASWRTGKTERIHGRLIRVITRVSDYFGGRPIVVISGFRPPSKEQYTLRSKHNLGRAIDFQIPGVPNEALRDFCRTLPEVGVGYYPNCAFVHLDIREQSAYWIDYSGPGEPPRYALPSGEDPAKAEPAKRSPRLADASAAKAKTGSKARQPELR